jgi:hypothetical protein
MKIVLILSVVLFVVACCLPALEFKMSQGPNDVMLGLRALAVGWSGLFAGIMSWYANPFWLLSLVLFFFRKPTWGMAAAVIAIALASSTFGIVGRELPGDEGNVTRMTVIRLLPGCYLWMASLVMLPVAALFQRVN